MATALSTGVVSAIKTRYPANRLPTRGKSAIADYGRLPSPSPDNLTMSKQLQTLTIKNLPIRLGQALKLADLVQDGFDARMRIQNGDVMVNGKVETRRGRQLTSGDTLTIDGQTRVIG